MSTVVITGANRGIGLELARIYKGRGEDVIARRYKVTAKDIDLVLWYSDDDQWVGLQSIAKSGHIIRYELS